MRPDDLPIVERIADVVHPDFFERPDVLAERLALFPDGCFCADGGYAIAHPARLGASPALDTKLGALPEGADVLHIHDIALLPAAQGKGLGTACVALLRTVAVRHGLTRLGLVAVHGTAPYWTRFGFAPAPACAGVSTYGAEARYMVADR